MKIIKRGTPKAEVVWEGECIDCKSIIQAKESELVVTQDQHDGSFGVAICLVCNNKQVIFYPKDNK